MRNKLRRKESDKVYAAGERAWARGKVTLDTMAEEAARRACRFARKHKTYARAGLVQDYIRQFSLGVAETAETQAGNTVATLYP